MLAPSFESPEYTAVIEFAPSGKVVVVNVATPLTTDTPLASTVEPSLNVIVPGRCARTRRLHRDGRRERDRLPE